MLRFLFALALLLAFSQPVHAQETPAADTASCEASGDGVTDYVQRGDDIILMECPATQASESGADCMCHEPPSTDGTCHTYACHPNGSPVEPEVKPAPRKVEEAAPLAEKPKAKPHKKKKKTEAPAPKKEDAKPAVDEKKSEAAPPPTAPVPAPPSSGKIEYMRRGQ